MFLVDVQEQGTKFLSKKILVNIDDERHIDKKNDMNTSTVFQV